MPTAKISDESHRDAKELECSIAEAIDRWRRRGQMFSELRMFYSQEMQAPVMVHRPRVTPYGELKAGCDYPGQGSPMMLGTRDVEQWDMSTMECTRCFE